MINTHTTMNINRTDDDELLSNNYVSDSVMAQGQIVGFRSASPTLERALTTYKPRTATNTVQQRRTEKYSIDGGSFIFNRSTRLLFSVAESANPLNTSSRVSIFVGKYPSDAALRNYPDLQTWMYIHANKHAPVDICQSLTRIILLALDNYDLNILFNVHLICAEAYQTVGNINQARSQYDDAIEIAANLGNRRAIMNLDESNETDERRKKLDDVEMKLKFQSQFMTNLSAERTGSTKADFFTQLSTDSPSLEQCRSNWRQIVLEFALDPSVAIPGAQWLLSYANRFPLNTIQHAKCLYVALNLFLFGYGSRIFQEDLDLNVFKILDNIARYFEENGNQSKQFSAVHKMAHVWGLAAVAFRLASDEYKYRVCASMMRVSFESLGICFPSSGVEPLYILARKHAPEFFMMMACPPQIKLISPDCINYFRRKLKNHDTAIRYSYETADQLASEVFNIDLTDHRI